MSITLRQQADELRLIGQERAAWVENLRRNPKRQAEADMQAARLPVLREAWRKLDQVAKDAGQ